MLDLSRLIPGPYATLLLSDLGADVVKIEDPSPGDYLRNISAPMFAALNRGKRSACIDLKTPDGVAALRRLAARADVLVEGFRPGVLQRLGIEPAQFPRLVVCSISGFGQAPTPWRERAGHDIGYIALAGVLARCRELPGVQIADFFGGGQQAVVAILAALVERAATGRGRWLDVSLTHGALGMVLPYLDAADDLLLGGYPCYRIYSCREGRLALGALEPKFWERFCAAVGKPEWTPRAFDRELSLDATFAEKTRDEWAALLGPADCCSEPVLELHELRAHPLFAESFVDGLPRTYPALAPARRGPAPALGQHTAEIIAP